MKRCFALLLSLLSLLLLGCDAKEASPISVHGFYFDTVITITAHCEEAVLQKALKSCAAYEKQFSKTIEGSEVYKLNHAGGASVEVSGEFLALLETAQRVSEASRGAFDVSIAPAAALWDFQAETPALPDRDALARAAALTDYRSIHVEGNRVTLREGMQLDLGGVAKGYISGQIARELQAAGVKRALLNFGGNIVTIGEKSEGVPWRIGIKNPADPYGAPLRVVESRGGALITSGTYERGFTLDGVRYHHILDTKTGMPVQNGVVQFSILCDDPALADALSTACLALGREGGLALAQHFGAEAVCVTEDGALYATPNVAFAD